MFTVKATIQVPVAQGDITIRAALVRPLQPGLTVTGLSIGEAEALSIELRKAVNLARGIEDL